jgi:CRP-like cAMP-binding protein
MPLEPKKSYQQHKVEAGGVLFSYGERASMLCIVHSGEIWYKDHTSGQKIIALGPNSSPGFSSLLTKSTYPYHVYAARESVISAFPVHLESFASIILNKLNVGLLSVRSIAQEFMMLHRQIQMIDQLNQKLQSVSDNLTVVYYKSNPAAFPVDRKEEPSDENHDPVFRDGVPLIRDYMEHIGDIPSPVTESWLKTDLTSTLRRSYAFEATYDAEEFSFLKRILSLPPEVQGEIYKKDLQILHGIGVRLTAIFFRALDDLAILNKDLENNMEKLFRGEYSLVEKFFLLSEVIDSGMSKITPEELNTTLRHIHEVGSSILAGYRSITGFSYRNLQPSFEKIKELLAKLAPEVKRSERSIQEDAAKAGVDLKAIKQELSESAKKIMNFLGYPPEESKAMLLDLKKLGEMTNPLDSSGDPRKLRRAIGKRYVDLYERALLKQNQKASLPLPVKLMLRFGYFDEQFLEDEHLVRLATLKDETQAKNIYPIVDAQTWVDAVASKKEPPSVDEMGQTFFERLKNENKDKGWKRETDLPEQYNAYEYRCKYEVHNFFDTTVRLTSGSPATAFPILTKYQITMPLEKAFVTRQRLSEVIDRILAIDYSAFHREVLVNDEKAGILKEFVQERVIPNFIVMPSIGTRVMMWQDLSTRNKNSTGRIALPIFATADLYLIVLEAIAAFRWELTKTIQGADWNNVSIPSITADYTDYVQFFKKNRDLTQEQKEKLAAEFKRFRTDRDRFVNDYINWIKFESEGVLKLNKVARGIFYRHVPFAKDIRDKIAAQPAYSELHHRFTNIRMKKFRELEVKYRKYGEALPEILRKNQEFYKV